MLHDHWRDYTPEEIEKIKRRKCVKCKYSTIQKGTQDRNSIYKLTCEYIVKEGHRRPWRPEDCPSMPKTKMRGKTPLIIGKERYEKIDRFYSRTGNR